MQRMKRPTELKIAIEKKTLINTNYENACEYVTVKECQWTLTLSFMENISRRELLYKNGHFLIKKVFGFFLSFNRNEVNGSFVLDDRCLVDSTGNI